MWCISFFRDINMAIFHLNYRHIKRSLGLSAVEQAAKITGESFFETRTARTFNYKKISQRIVVCKTMFPFPDFESLSTCNFWNNLENYEDTYAESYYKKPETIEKYKTTACIAILIRVALPIELLQKEQIKLVEEFVKKRFLERYLVVTYGIHEVPNNPHAFLLVSRRALDENGKLPQRKDCEICTKLGVIATRECWANLVNYYLKKEGIDERVTHKSFADLEITRAPAKRLGWKHHKQKREQALTKKS